MNYRLDLGVWGSVFAVPSCVVDNYIKIADEKQLKVLLYLLKNPSVQLRAEDIAAVTGVDVYGVEDALIFWENVGVLSSSGGTLTPPQGEPQALPAEKPAASAKVKLTADTQFPPKEIAGAVNNDKAVCYLFETFEKLAGRPTKHAERNTLMLLIEEVGLTTEVALMLVEYCFSVDKATPAYMKSVALEWYESGIDSIGKAEERIKTLKSRQTLENRLRSKFGMASAFSKSQKDIIAEWSAAAYDDGLIDEAYDVCMKNTGRLNIKYMDSVLRGWADKGITSAGQARADKRPETSGSSFNVDELEMAAYAKYKKTSE